MPETTEPETTVVRITRSQFGNHLDIYWSTPNLKLAFSKVDLATLHPDVHHSLPLYEAPIITNALAAIHAILDTLLEAQALASSQKD
ncbi:MAG: hypothetical protein PHE72_14610 [candidate division Zixibacteria bacterium]|nr:hypothetical protein [candidate division Zixibacteria bacterium]